MYKSEYLEVAHGLGYSRRISQFYHSSVSGLLSLD